MKRIFKCLALMVMVAVFIIPVRVDAAENSGYEYKTNSDGRTVVITAYKADDKTEIKIPSDIAGSKVTGIEDGVFTDNNIKKIWIPSSVTDIGDGTFSSENKDLVIYCAGDSYAHSYAVKYGYAFELDQSMQIRKKFADGDVSISGIKTKNYTGSAISQNQIVVKYDGVKLKKDRDYTLTYRNNQKAGVAAVTIKGIGNYTGNIRKTFRIVVPKGKKYKVGSYEYKVTKAAANGQGTVTLMGAVYNINSKKYNSLKIAATVNIGGIKFKVTEIAPGAFRNYICFKSIEIGSNIKKIGNEAFSGCWNVKTVKIGTAVTAIGNKAFYGCKKIRSVTVKTGRLVKVGAKAFTKIKPGVVVRVQNSKKTKYKSLMKRGGMTAGAVYRKL